MKKTITLLLLTSLFAGSLLGATLDEAQKAYEQKQYDLAIGLLKKDIAGYSDAQTHILWGESAEALGHDEEAVSAYERALMIDDSNIDVKITLARLYNKINMSDNAKELVNALSQYNLTPTQRSALAALGSEKESLNKFRASAGIALGYDSNINASAGAGNLDVYYQDLGLSGVQVSDVAETAFISYKANASYVHELGEAKGFYLQGDANFYGQNNFSASDYDTYYGRASAGLGYKFDRLSLYVPLDYDRVYYLQRDLMQTFGTSPLINAVITSNIILSTGFKYQVRRYINEADSNRDDNLLGLNMTLIGIVGKNMLYLRGNIEDYSAQKQTSTFVNKDLFNVSTGLTYNLAKGYSVGGNYRFRYANFADAVTPTSLLIRRDIYNSVNLNASMIFYDSFQATLDYKFINNNSNYVPAQYFKHIMTAGLQYNY